MMCDICGKKSAMIHIEGEGNFCLDCHNERMSSRFGMDKNSFNYPAEAAFTDKDGNLHFFRLTHMFLGNMIRWQAVECGGCYEVVMLASIGDSVVGQISGFYRKISDTLWNRTLEEGSSEWETGEALKDHGNIDIQYSADTEEVSFVIDGKQFSLKEFGRMLESYAGWTLQYQVRDKSEERVKENEFLMPVELTREALLGELRQAIFTFSDSKDIDHVQFVSYENTDKLFDAIVRVTDKLELLCSKGPLEEAVKVGEEMIGILEETETDDDFFPEYEISMIEQIIYRFWPRPDKA